MYENILITPYFPLADQRFILEFYENEPESEILFNVFVTNGLYIGNYSNLKYGDMEQIYLILNLQCMWCILL